MNRHIALVPFIALLAATPAGAAKPQPPMPPSTESLIDHAKVAVRDGTADPASDLGPLLARLSTTSDERDQKRLIRAIEDLGKYDAANPASVKAYLREAAPPLMLAIARSKAPRRVRTEALLALSALNVDASVLDEAIALAAADTSADQVALRGHARMLADWKVTRKNIGDAQASPVPASPAKEQAALVLLRRQHERVSALSLSQAAIRADAEVVAALLDMGFDVNALLLSGKTALELAAGEGCAGNEASVDARLATIDLLIQRGAEVAWKDKDGNTILMCAMDCPVPVVEKLIAAGASFQAANSQGYTPLAIAFEKDRWDIAELLVARGARVSQRAIDKLFFELPTDPGKLSLIRRATAATKK
ncbi:MAG: ankyrin repeat domain-containing protein [Thermoanaerobaculia bacterium]